jgi:hypothetical protein
MSDFDLDGSPLRTALEKAAAAQGCSLGALTVLAQANDPFRQDTPAHHRDGAWLASTAQRLGLGDRRIHLRGLHYRCLGEPKPDGTPYSNDDAGWAWLSENCAKAARQLEGMQEQVDAINDALRIDADDYDLPEINIPAAELDGARPPEPLIDSRWSFARQSLALVNSKRYGA